MAEAPPATVLTIGHSNHPTPRFIALLRQAGVTAVADVRSAPYSRHQPQFNIDVLKKELRAHSIAYAFLGEQLGGRPKDLRLYSAGVADYERMARTQAFVQGLDRVVEGARTYRVVLMCSEQDPLDCHRCLLVGRALHDRGIAVRHLLSDGGVADHAQVEDRLLELSGRAENDLFASRADRLVAAYRERSRKAAFADPELGPQGPVAAE